MALQRIIWLSVLGLGLILIALLGSGVRQYSLYAGHKAIADQSETLLFRFTIIREQLMDELLQAENGNLENVSRALEQFNSSLSSVLADRRIADEYKLGFMQAVDISGMVVMVRQLDARPHAPELRRNLNREMRILGERLLLFDRLVVDQAKRRLVGFQNILIGTLALLFFGALVALFWGYRRVVLPLVCLNSQGKEVLDGDRLEISCPADGRWLSGVVAMVNDLLRHDAEMADRLERQVALAAMGRRAIAALSQARTMEQVGVEVCRALRHNSDYCLVWLGCPLRPHGLKLLGVAGGGPGLVEPDNLALVSGLPVAGREPGKDSGPVQRALATGEPVVISDYLATVSPGLLQDTKLAGRRAAYGVFPLSEEEEGLVGVLAVFSTANEGFAPCELDLLQGVATAVGMALRQFSATAPGREHKWQLLGFNLAESGGIMAGVAHEVSDLANGMINYAQILADEPQEQQTQREIAAKLIGTGEQLTGIMKKTIFYSRGGGHDEEFLPLGEVLADAITLSRFSMKGSGILVEQDLPADFPSLPVNARRMQQVFMLLCEQARRTLDLRYPTKDQNKRLLIKGEISSRKQGRCLRLCFNGQSSRIDPELLAGLQEVVAEQGGELQLDTTGAEAVVKIEFPC